MEVNVRKEGENDGKVKRSRASKPKVRTGCTTCKIRRVKCDETKPNCSRCLKFGHQCDGYEQFPKRLSRTAGNAGFSPRILVPKASLVSLASSPTASTTSSPDSPASCSAAAFRMPASSPFKNDEEHRNFRRFCARTAGGYDLETWMGLMLKAYTSSPSIRQTVLSVGSLSPSPGHEVGTLKHQFVYRSYRHAHYLHPTHDLRSTLIACLLFNCFESFHGYHECAINQVTVGLKGIGELFGGGADVEQRLEWQALWYADARNAEIHERYSRCGQSSIDEMPHSFVSLQEARVLLEIIIRRSMHWLASTLHLHDFSSAKERRLFFDVDPCFKEQRRTLQEFERWREAFDPLLRSKREGSGPGEENVLAMMLRLHWLAGYLTVASSASSSSLDSGRFTAELEEIVAISRRLLARSMEEEDGSSSFAFDMHVIVPLTTVGWLSRHRALQREAIALLMSSPRREGVCDGILVAKIMIWLARIEEECLTGDEDYVPDEAAASRIRMHFDAKLRRAYVSCIRPIKSWRAGVEEGQEVETWIPW